MSPNIFTSLEHPPTNEEVRSAIAEGVTIFDFDLDQDGGVQAAKIVNRLGGHVTAYHVGGGGGRAWGSVAAGEQVRGYRNDDELAQLSSDVERLVRMGANSIHFDNTHRMSGRTLSKVSAAVVAGGARLVLKNNPEKWNLLIKREPETLRHVSYAVIEGAISDKWETEQAKRLSAAGLAVYVIAFVKGFDKGSQSVTPERAIDFVEKNSWARVILMKNEAAYDSRDAQFFGFDERA